MPRRRLVLLGIGHTNAHIVKEWAADPIPNVGLVCISKFPTATYSGMLPGTLGEQFDDDEWRIDLSQLCRHAGAELLLGEVNGLDLDAGELSFVDRPNLRFDALSIGVGSMPAGWSEYDRAESFVAIKPMQTFLQRLDIALEQAGSDENSTVNVAIVGGGVASIEIALCLLQKLKMESPSRDFSITIYSSDETIAGGMTARSRQKIERLLAARGVEVVRDCRIAHVDHDHIESEDGRRFPANAVIWATGAAAPPVLSTLGLQIDERGFIATSDTLQSLSDERVFAVGDSGTILDLPVPKAGVYAVRQCPILSHNLRAFFDDGSLKRFDPQSNFLKILNTGDGKALLEYGWLTAHARWCWHLKAWIDRRFISEFQANSEKASK